MKRKLLSLALTLAMVTALTPPAVASGQATVHASTTEELLAALKSNTTITLEAKEYPIDWLEILEMENVTIQGVPGTRLTPLDKGYPFILVTESSNITIKNISIGHDTYETLVDIYGAGFDGGLVAISDAKNVLVDGCELYGNGSVGIDVFMGSGIQVRNTTVRDCSGPIAGLADGDMTFTNCTFTGNSFGALGGEPCFSALSLDAYSVNTSMTFKDCTFTGNKGECFAYPTDNTQSINILFLDTVGSTSRWKFGEFVVSTTLENCTFSSNSWTAPIGTSAPQPSQSPAPSAAPVPATPAPGQKSVQANTPEELREALESNTFITLAGTVYDMKELENTSYTLFLDELTNVTIQGSSGTRVLCSEIESGVNSTTLFQADDSTGLVIRDIEFVGAPQADGVHSRALATYDSSVTLVNCTIRDFSTAVDPMRTDLTMENCTVQDCSHRIIELVDSKAVFRGCTFTRNGPGAEHISWAAFGVQTWDGDVSAIFSQCAFVDNGLPHFFGEATEGHTAAYQVDKCTFTGNGWSDPADTGAAPAGNLAYASTQEIEVDGKKVTFEAYALKDANGNDTNYIKLRDVASVLNGTAAQFEVGWNGSVTITTGQAYTPNGSEMSTPYSGNRAYKDASAATVVNGSPVQLSAILLTDDSGNGYTYYKLRDLGEALGFTVDWTAERGIFIETN